MLQKAIIFLVSNSLTKAKSVAVNCHGVKKNDLSSGGRISDHRISCCSKAKSSLNNCSFHGLKRSCVRGLISRLQG